MSALLFVCTCPNVERNVARRSRIPLSGRRPRRRLRVHPAARLWSWSCLGRFSAAVFKFGPLGGSARGPVSGFSRSRPGMGRFSLFWEVAVGEKLLIRLGNIDLCGKYRFLMYALFVDCCKWCFRFGNFVPVRIGI